MDDITSVAGKLMRRPQPVQRISSGGRYAQKMRQIDIGAEGRQPGGVKQDTHRWGYSLAGAAAV